MIRHYWFSTRRMTVIVTTVSATGARDLNEYVMVEGTAPILRCWAGQPVVVLISWLRLQGGCRQHAYEA